MKIIQIDTLFVQAHFCSLSNFRKTNIKIVFLQLFQIKKEGNHN